MRERWSHCSVEDHFGDERVVLSGRGVVQTYSFDEVIMQKGFLYAFFGANGRSNPREHMKELAIADNRLEYLVQYVISNDL